MKPISILIVDDHRVVRQGFAKLLSMEQDFEVVGEAADGRTAIELAIKLAPDIILMDIAMPNLNGLEATSLLLHSVPEAKVLVLTSYSDDAYVTSSKQAGAKGFLRKQSPGSEVCTAIRAVQRGGLHFGPSVSDPLNPVEPAPSASHRSSTGELTPSLSSRERQVLQLIAEGKANKEMAFDLNISIKTVGKHRANLMRKLDLHETAGLTRYAISNGLVENHTLPTD